MAIKNLTFTTLPASNRNAADARRAKTIERLEEQKLLVANPSHVRTVKRWAKINGEKSLIEKQRRVYPWWRTAPDGSVVFFIRQAGKPIEFEKGKAGITVGTKDKLATVIDTLIAAVRSGDLDDALAQAAKARPAPKRKAA
jgi:hypothetical protein